MSTSIGIHLGNTSACVAVSRNEKVDVVANSHGDRLTPAMVTFNPEETLVGFSSKQSSHRYISETVRHSSSLLGRRWDDSGFEELLKDFSNVGMKIVNREGIPAYDIQNNAKSETYTAKEVFTIILKNALETAQTQTGADVNEVVVAAPVGYSAEYCNELTDAATSAGFEVLRVISEPAAAVLAYGIEESSEPYRTLVFRVGGMSQDVTILKIINGMITIETSIGRKCGGDVLTDDIANHFASMFERENRCSIKKNFKAMRKLRTQSEKCKHVLSTMPTASCHIDSLYDGIDFNGNLSRSRFEMLVSDHLHTLADPIKTIIQNSGLQSTDIRNVIMCGGTSNIPKLQEIVAKLLPDSKLLCSIPSSEVIAIGAAVQSGLLVDLESPEITDHDCEVHMSAVNLHVQVLDKTEMLIKSGSFLPLSVNKEYLIPLDKDECQIKLLYSLDSESPHKETNLTPLSTISLEDLTAGKCIDVHLKYVANGNLICTCTDKESGSSKSVTIPPS